MCTKKKERIRCGEEVTGSSFLVYLRFVSDDSNEDGMEGYREVERGRNVAYTMS